MITIILLSIAGAIISAIIGTVWYSNATPMGRLHMRYLGFDKLSAEQQQAMMAQGKSMMPKLYAGQMLLSFLTAFATVVIITMSLRGGLSFGTAIGFVAFNWLCFVVPTIGGALLWGNCDRAIVWQKFFSDILYSLVTLTVIAVVTNLFV